MNDNAVVSSAAFTGAIPEARWPALIAEIRVLNEWKSTGAVFLYMVAYFSLCGLGGGSPDCRQQ